MEGTVPTPNGEIKLYMDTKTIKVSATEGLGYLIFSSKSKPKFTKGTIEKLEGDKYRLLIDGKEEVVLFYN